MKPDEATVEELPAVAALRSLSIFSANQGGAYREHFAALAEVLGADVQTRLGSYITRWAHDGTPGTIVLTGNAGTGKTAVAEAYCLAGGGALPPDDGLVEIQAGRWVIKDLSGLPDPPRRAEALREALRIGQSGQSLVCANEGVVRDALESLADPDFTSALESALRQGAARSGSITVVNVNRQRPTADGIWEALLDYLTRETLWAGCTGCPFDRGGCPMRSNSEALRSPVVREQLRTLVRLGAGEAVPTMREVLAILAWAIVGGQGCRQVKDGARDLDRDAFTASHGYFTRLVGGGLSLDAIERSPLLTGMRNSGLGEVSDLEIDGWLRDTTGAPDQIRRLAGDPQALGQDSVHEPPSAPALVGSCSPLDRLRTKQGTMTFHHLGETVSTSEDSTKVEDGLDALVTGDGQDNAPGQALWRQRLYFEGANALGGSAYTASRLLDYRYLPDLVKLARKASVGGDTVLEVTDLVCGLNFLVTGFASPHEGLVVPDPACLFARDPGSFRPARPSLVHSQVLVDRLTVKVPDVGLVEEILDVDHVDVELVVDGDPALSLRIRPRMYEAIREAAEFHGPVGQGVAEMNDLRSFYGRLAASPAVDGALRIADPDSSPPALVKVNLPHFLNTGDQR